jgi:ligand-binding SRPBCC domain-containing protein
MTVTFQRTSIVPADPSEVWRRVTTPDGINHELMPVMRMTVPRKLRGKAIDQMPLREKIGRSWLLLFGLIPFDYDDLMLAERDDGLRFLEQSTMMSMSAWEHERTLVACDRGTQVTDRIRFTMRPPLGWIPGAHAVLGAALRWLFGHRHRKMMSWFEQHRSTPALGPTAAEQ